MHNSDLLPDTRPVLPDLISCDRWLDQQRFADASHACAAFAVLLEQLEEAPPEPGLRVQILERLREPMLASLEDLAQRFAGKALPLTRSEDDACQLSCDLWASMARAWGDLFRLQHRKPETAGDARLLLRRLECHAGLVQTQLAARRDVVPEHWRWLNQDFAAAEKHALALGSHNMGAHKRQAGDTGGGNAGASVKLNAVKLNAVKLNAVNGNAASANADGAKTASYALIYARLLLLQLANPASLSQREFVWTERLARRWAHKVRLWRSAEKRSGMIVDLAGSAGARWSAGSTGISVLVFDCAALVPSIRTRLKKLAAGVTPEELGLGKDCPPQAAEVLLQSLQRSWGEAPPVRQFPRRASRSRIELVATFANMHAAIGGPVVDAGNLDSGKGPWQYAKQEYAKQVDERVTPLQKFLAAASPAESWESLDESANGFRIRRVGAGLRIAHRQLVALQPAGASQFILCEVRWLHQALDGSLRLGAKAMPGLPQACSVRPASDAAADTAVTRMVTVRGGWTQAFALPLSKGLEPNLVLPIGWYQQGREIELKLGDDVFKVRLEDLVARGHDYQRARFTVLGSS